MITDAGCQWRRDVLMMVGIQNAPNSDKSAMFLVGFWMVFTWYSENSRKFSMVISLIL